MASASESQTGAGDGADEDSTASEREGTLRRGLLGEGLMGAQDGRRRGMAGDSGRGEHVLVGRRLSPQPEALSDRRLSWDGLRTGTWGSALFDALEAHAPKRRASPAPRPLRPARARPLRPSEPPIPRAPTPPLTIDDIAASSFNPFPLFHIRTHLVPEVFLLVTAFLFALGRLYTISPSATHPSIFPLPLASLAFLALATPFIAIFRRPDAYFKAPFTDERGYRDPSAADDGIAAAIILPLLLATACYWDTYSSASGGGAAVGLGGIRPFGDIWESSGIHAKSKLGSFDPATLSTPFALARGLLQARHELVLLTSLNAVVLLLHLALSRTLLRIEKLPKNNTKRFFGFMGVSGGISVFVYAGLTIWDWAAKGALWLVGEEVELTTTADGLPLSPLEAGVSTFIQQSSFYIVSRLARRGFTLGELNTMTVAGNALCLEFWRLSRSRVRFRCSRSLKARLMLAARTVALQARIPLRPADVPLPYSHPRLSIRPHPRRLPLWFPPLPTPRHQPPHRLKAEPPPQGSFASPFRSRPPLTRVPRSGLVNANAIVASSPQESSSGSLGSSLGCSAVGQAGCSAAVCDDHGRGRSRSSSTAGTAFLFRSCRSAAGSAGSDSSWSRTGRARSSSLSEAGRRGSFARGGFG